MYSAEYLLYGFGGFSTCRTDETIAQLQATSKFATEDTESTENKENRLLGELCALCG